MRIPLLLASLLLLPACGGGGSSSAPAPTPTPLPDPGFGARSSAGTLQETAITEASGIAASRKNPGVLWVHNDSGDVNRVFALTPAGTHLGIYTITGAGAVDWEDLAIGALGAVVLADTRRLADCFPSLDYFEEMGLPFLVAVNCFDGRQIHTSDAVRRALDLDPTVPILLCDARERRSARDVLVALVEHGDDVRMVQRCGGLRLPHEAAQEDGIARVRRVHELDGDRAFQSFVEGVVHHRHATLGDFASDAVALFEEQAHHWVGHGNIHGGQCTVSIRDG